MKYYLLNATLLINIMVSSAAVSKDLETALRAYKAKNYSEAQRLLSDISETDPKAFLYLGYMFEYGEGQDISIEKALEYYKKAATAGLDEAKSRIAEIQMYN
jgi:TPR repeat protein